MAFCIELLSAQPFEVLELLESELCDSEEQFPQWIHVKFPFGQVVDALPLLDVDPVELLEADFDTELVPLLEEVVSIDDRNEPIEEIAII